MEKGIFLTHGFDSSQLAQAFRRIDASKADCWDLSGKDMIRKKIQEMMIDQQVVPEGTDVTDSLKAFTRVLKLLLILKPTSYAKDIEAVLSRAPEYEKYDLEKVTRKCAEGGRLICIAGGPGEGKSTLAAAMVKRIKVDAYHLCKKADVRRQDKALIIRSLSYQLAIKNEKFGESLLSMSSTEVESIEDVSVAWKLLVERPLNATTDLNATILINALDESGVTKKNLGPVMTCIALFRGLTS